MGQSFIFFSAASILFLVDRSITTLISLNYLTKEPYTIIHLRNGNDICGFPHCWLPATLQKLDASATPRSREKFRADSTVISRNSCE